MKKICLFALLSISAFTMVPSLSHAQTTDAPQKTGRSQRTAEDRAKFLTTRMEKELTLSADQRTKVEAINLKKSQELDAIRAKYANDRRQGFQEMKTVKQGWDDELKAVLSAEQFTKYQQMQEDRRDNMQEHRKAKQG